MYRNYWIERYKANASDWPIILAMPLFDPDGRWTFGGPRKIVGEIQDAMVLVMGEAPQQLVQMKVQRAKEAMEAVESLDLLNADPRHANNEHSKIDYLRSRLTIELFDGHIPPDAAWHELALLRLQLFEALIEEGTPAPEQKLHAALYFLLGHAYGKAKEILDGIRNTKAYVYGDKFELVALRSLAEYLVMHGSPVRDEQVVEDVLSYFDQMRNPQPDRVPGKPYKQFSKSTLDKFEWGLLVGEIIAPGDGKLDAWRALELVSQ